MGQSGSHSTNNVPYLLQLPPELVYHVLDYIPPHDISKVSRSCSVLNRLVRSYLWFKVTSELLSEWSYFLDHNSGLLTVQERLVDHIRKEQDILDIKSIYRLLSLKTDTLGQIRRVSCLEDDVTVVSDKDVIILWDERLSRNVRLVDRVRWLQMTYTWQLEDPCSGKYKVSVRLRLEKNFTWPLTRDQPTVWTVKYPEEAAQGKLEVEVDKKWWRMIWRKEQPEGRLKVVLEDDGWVSVIFPVIYVTKTGPVTVELRDTVCNYWKGGVKFDYFQICKIS